jgi:hypothetical protein
MPHMHELIAMIQQGGAKATTLKPAGNTEDGGSEDNWAEFTDIMAAMAQLLENKPVQGDCPHRAASDLGNHQTASAALVADHPGAHIRQTAPFFTAVAAGTAEIPGNQDAVVRGQTGESTLTQPSAPAVLVHHAGLWKAAGLQEPPEGKQGPAVMSGSAAPQLWADQPLASTGPSQSAQPAGERRQVWPLTHKGIDRANTFSAPEPKKLFSDDPSAAFLRSATQAADSRLHPAGGTLIETPESTSNGSGTSRTMETDLIRQIVQRMTLHTAGGRASMQIRLKPEFLGSLRMQIVTEDRMIMIRIATQSSQVKEMIERHVEMLKTELQQHGLQVQKVDVSVASDKEAWGGEQQQTAFRQAQDHHQRSNRRSVATGVNAGQSDPLTRRPASAPADGNGLGEVDFFA